MPSKILVLFTWVLSLGAEQPELSQPSSTHLGLSGQQEKRSDLCRLRFYECSLLRHSVQQFLESPTVVEVCHEVQAIHDFNFSFLLGDFASQCHVWGVAQLEDFAAYLLRWSPTLLHIFASRSHEVLLHFSIVFGNCAQFLRLTDVYISDMIRLRAELQGVSRRLSVALEAGQPGYLEYSNNIAWQHFGDFATFSTAGCVVRADDRVSETQSDNVSDILDFVDQWFEDHGAQIERTFCVSGRLVSSRGAAFMPVGLPDRRGPLDGVATPCGNGLAFSIFGSDVEMLLHLRSAFVAPSVFVIGNGMGVSTAVLAHIFPDGQVDVLSLGGDACFDAGLSFAQEFLREAGVRGTVVDGRSPSDVPGAASGTSYDLVIIDGDHAKDSVIADFVAIYPYLAPSCVVVFHDGQIFPDVPHAIATLLAQVGNQFSHHVWHGELYRNIPAISFLYRGLSRSFVRTLRNHSGHGPRC